MSIEIDLGQMLDDVAGSLAKPTSTPASATTPIQSDVVSKVPKPMSLAEMSAAAGIKALPGTEIPKVPKAAIKKAAKQGKAYTPAIATAAAMAPMAPSPAPVAPIPQAGLVHVAIPQELYGKLSLPVKGQGGWQSVVQAIASQTTFGVETGTATVTLYPALTKRLISYSIKFGGGGYQTMIRHLLCCYLATVNHIAAPVVTDAAEGEK